MSDLYWLTEEQMARLHISQRARASRETEISAQIMVLGMTEGWFTRKRFASYLPAKGPATTVHTSARRIINGIDRAEKVAGYAMSFQAALVVRGWA